MNDNRPVSASGSASSVKAKPTKRSEINDFIKSNQNLSREELAERCGLTKNAVTKREQSLGITRDAFVQSTESVATDISKKNEKSFTEVLKKKYGEALEEIVDLKDQLQGAFQIKKTVQTFKIVSEKPESSESTAFIIVSDLHIEEEVKSATINGMNEFNLEIGKQRVIKLFQNGLKLLQMSQKETKISKLVIALLGDNINNSIHEEFLETNQLLPGDAARFAQELLVSGIEYILKNSDVDIVIPCHSGNHGRMTKQVHVSTEGGNSLERYMYRNMADYFRDNKRVQFIIAEGQHTYLDVYNMTVRFMHGHSVKFGGGVGGVTIPIRKALAQWNKVRKAHLTVMGHFHQMLDGGDFIVNGSVIGYNAYALSIKADYEPPRQVFFLINNYNGGEKTLVSPIRLT